MTKKQNGIIYGPEEDTSIKKGELVYDPVAGLTIKQAINGAIFESKKNHGEHVHAIINDVHMHITGKTSPDRAYDAFMEIANARLAEARRACQQQAQR